MKKTIPFLALLVLLCAEGNPTPSKQSDTSGIYKEVQDKIRLDERIKKLEAAGPELKA
jgi:hypothetical protein